MRILTIDFGNTRVKLDLWHDENHIERQVVEDCSPQDVVRIANEWNTDRIVVCSVRKDHSSFLKKLGKSAERPVVDFNKKSREVYVDKIQYRGNLGSDRLAAFIGAEKLFPDEEKMIVDSGTALTIDIADREGNFCGGNISLGIRSRLKALASSTSLLPLVEETRNCPAFGTDTVSAIFSGALLGVAAEIVCSFKRARQIYDVKKIIITGGEAGMILPAIESEITQIYQDPYLVSRGIMVTGLD